MTKNIILALIFSTLFIQSSHSDIPSKPVILAIGASLINGKIPFNNGMESPLFGASTNKGDFLDLSGALYWYQQIVINEAQAGATTFKRPGCNPECGSGYWESYETQLSRAMARVFDPVSGNYGAKYVIIGISNDCLHADSFGIPMSQAVQCDTAELNTVIDELVNVGQIAMSAGIKPIYNNYPDYKDWDMSLLSNLGIPWGISKSNFNYLKTEMKKRLNNEVPGSILLDTWNVEYARIPGDPVHPDKSTSLRGALKVIEAINLDMLSE